MASPFLVPLVGYAVTGYRAGRRSGRVASGMIASAVAGVVSGVAAGLSFVLFDNPPLNIPVGMALGCTAGAVWERSARSSASGRAKGSSPLQEAAITRNGDFSADDQTGEARR